MIEMFFLLYFIGSPTITGNG